MTQSSMPLKRGRKPAAMLAAGGLLLSSAVLGFAGQSANASSHREAPLIAMDPAVDNTDVYAFTSPDDPNMVTFAANWIPFEEPNGGPNFYPWATDAYYDINIDNDGDAVADIIFRWEFFTEDLRGLDTFLYNNGPVTSLDDENLLFHQYYTLDIINVDSGQSRSILGPEDRAESAPSYTGDASMGGEEGYEALRADATEPLPNERITGGGTTVATQADDSFFLDLRVFDLLYGGDLSEIGQDTLACYNVNSIVLNVRKEVVALNQNKNANPVIGVWSTTSRAPLRDAAGTAVDPITDANEVQVSRLGNPLVNEVVIPTGLKDAFNSIEPVTDATIPEVVDRVLNPEVPQLIEAIYGIEAPPTPRYDLFEVFLTGIVTNDVVDVDGDPNTPNPLEIDLNSQALNAAADPAAFQPSEMLRLNMSTPVAAEPSRLGVVGGDVQGFPNGRRLADDVLDIELLALEGVYDINNIPQDRLDAGVAALAGGDAVDANNKAFSDTFPYLALPNTQAVNQCGGDGPN
ncbi:MAG: DUF4331 domain-containing protein, partial [Actinomycetota bacterium]|nr:DUF4331 domain-containing protein [Actinomycetota bacterium]